MKLEWKPVPQGTFGESGERGYLGKILVARAGWNYSRSRNEGPETLYAGAILLPGFKRDAVTVKMATVEEVKAALEAKVAEWCKAAKLTAIA